jgi:carotenoid cleavage dioxygenase-like enzyme
MPQTFPRSPLTGTRQRLRDHVLDVEGTVPDDLRGDFFVLSAMGDPTSPATGPQRGVPVLNGDGWVYRVRFRDGRVTLSCDGLTTLDALADQITDADPAFADLRFTNAGITRASTVLGARDMSNTALTPYREGGAVALLACYDGGRPLVVDPETLEARGSLVPRDAWMPQMYDDALFPQVMSGAHPAFDSTTGELFAINYRRSLAQIAAKVLEAVFGVHWRRRRKDKDVGLTPEQSQLLDELDTLLSHQEVEPTAKTVDKGLGTALRQVVAEAWDLARTLRDRLARLTSPPEVRLLRKRSDRVDRYRVQVAGEPIRVQNSLHQIGVTQRYVVLADTTFKWELDLILSGHSGLPRSLRRRIRERASGPQLDHLPVWIVARADLHDTDGRVGTVEALSARIAREAIHFFTAYDDAEGIEILAAHGCGSDPAEFLDDTSIAHFTGKDVDPSLWGMFGAGFDANLFGHHRLIVADGAVAVESRLSPEEEAPCWGVGLGTAPDHPSLAPADVRVSYWQTFGLVPELTTRLLHRIYTEDATYPHAQRIVLLEEWARRMAAGGEPPTVVRVEVTDDRPRVTARWDFQADLQEAPLACCTPQHAPATPSTHEGYLLCTVFGDQVPKRRLVVLRASDLSRVCTVDLDPADWSYTLHGTWLPDLERGGDLQGTPLEQDLSADAIANHPALVEALRARQDG